MQTYTSMPTHLLIMHTYTQPGGHENGATRVNKPLTPIVQVWLQTRSDQVQQTRLEAEPSIKKKKVLHTQDERF